MAITIGTQLGGHEITALLGKGGMGEVYRARDTKLKREVAIKILPDEFARDTDRVSRFQREAEVLASLNHPNIAAIYDFQEANGTRFLVLELVEGETLADRIARGRIPVEEALEIGKHICEALEGAHEKGIVHRDLKPSNVKLTPDGKVKVLDFGLAKAMENSPASVTLSNSPTMLSGAMGGVIVGTAGYMSPEQAKGRSADQRSDVFAFGCVLYEMLSGRQAFQGEDVSDILAAVLKTEPVFEALPLDTPAPIQKLIRRCLEKDPRRRIPHIAVARFALEDELQRPSKSESVTTSSAEHRAHKRLLIALVIAAVFLVLSVALGVMNFLHREPPQAASIRFQFDAPAGSVLGNTVEPGRGANPPAPNFAISPDGTRLAYVLTSDGEARLWVRRLEMLTGQPLPGTESASFPFWSPDSRFIAFFAAGKLKRIDASGGPPQIICDARAGEGGAWNTTGDIIFTPDTPGGLFHVSAGGGVPSQITKPDASRHETDHVWPKFLPDGRHFIYLAIRSDDKGHDLFAGSLDSSDRTLVLEGTKRSAYTSGYLLFIRQSTLMAQAFDPSRLRLASDPVPIVENIANAESAGPGGFYGVGKWSIGISNRRRTANDSDFMVRPRGQETRVHYKTGGRSDHSFFAR